MLRCSIVEFSSVIETGTGQEVGSDEAVGYSGVKVFHVKSAVSRVNPLNDTIQMNTSWLYPVLFELLQGKAQKWPFITFL